MAGGLQKHSVVVAGHPTSVSLEAPFWDILRRIAARRGISVNELVTEIDRQRSGNLSSALRIFALEQARSGAPLSRPGP